MSNPTFLVQKLWNYWNPAKRDDCRRFAVKAELPSWRIPETGSLALYEF